MMLNPWVILVVVGLWAASVAGAYYKGYENGGNAEIAKQKKIEDVTKAVRLAAQEGAADAIAKIKITHTTVRQQATREISTAVVYQQCRHTPDGLRYTNQALTGTLPAGPGVVRPADRVDGRQLRNDNPQTDRRSPKP